MGRERVRGPPEAPSAREAHRLAPGPNRPSIVRDDALGSGARVLVAVRDSDLRSTVIQVLAQAGFSVDEATDAATTLSRARRRRPAVVVLDLDLPNRGYERVLQDLRASPATRHLPVLALTARGRPDEAVAALVEGADDFVAKPLDFDELRVRVGALADGRESVAAAARSSLRLELFGPLRVYQGQRVVIDEHFTRRKARALLALLWLQRGRWLPSEEIIETLWPEAEPALGRGRLRQTVLVLRSAIEPPQEPGAGWRYIMEREGAYCFNPTADASSDVDEFERAIDQARAARRVADPDAALASYERAIDLHRSELLPEFRSEEWVAAESARLEEFYRQALEEAGDLYGARGDHARAVELLRQVIREDPLRERPYLSLMRFLWFQGQHVEALRVYQQLRDVLATALQVAPEPEATDLAEAIRRDRPIDG